MSKACHRPVTCTNNIDSVPHELCKKQPRSHSTRAAVSSFDRYFLRIYNSSSLCISAAAKCELVALCG